MWYHFQLFGDWPPATRGTPARDRRDAAPEQQPETEGGKRWITVAGEDIWWNPEYSRWEYVEMPDSVPRAPPQASAGSTDQSEACAAALGTVEILNIKKGDCPPRECIIIPAGDILGRLDHYIKSELKARLKKCCGANGRIQLILVKQRSFQDVTKLVKGHVLDYLNFPRAGKDPEKILRLTSCGCTPVSHIF